jgi:tetratricopeptide (TPR) repeat protein
MARRAPAAMAKFAALSLLALIAPGARADEIALYGGEPLKNVVVTDETAALVTYEPDAGGSPQTLAAARVRAVEHSRSSDAWRVAVECEAALRFDEAARLYRMAAASPPRALAWERQYGLYRAAECDRLAGRADEAAARYRELLKQMPGSRFRGDCLERLATGALAVGDLATARSLLEELRDDAVSAGLGRRWQLRAELRLQQMDEGKDPDAALLGYVAFESRAAGYPDVQNLARLRAGRLRLARGQRDRAQLFFQKAFDERELLEPEIAAGASNGLGLCLLAHPEGREPSAADRQAALVDFLRTALQYGPRLGRNELVAEAEVEAARELLREGGEANLARAHELRDRCLRDYPGTTWAQRAAELR